MSGLQSVQSCRAVIAGAAHKSNARWVACSAAQRGRQATNAPKERQELESGVSPATEGSLTQARDSLERALQQSVAHTLQPSNCPQEGSNTSPLHGLHAAWEAILQLEQRLEADAATVLNTLVFVVAAIVYERGVQDVLDRLCGDSVLGDVACTISGFCIVLWARIQVSARGGWSTMFTMDEDTGSDTD